MEQTASGSRLSQREHRNTRVWRWAVVSRSHECQLVNGNQHFLQEHIILKATSESTIQDHSLVLREVVEGIVDVALVSSMYNLCSPQRLKRSCETSAYHNLAHVRTPLSRGRYRLPWRVLVLRPMRRISDLLLEFEID